MASPPVKRQMPAGGRDLAISRFGDLTSPEYTKPQSGAGVDRVHLVTARAGRQLIRWRGLHNVGMVPYVLRQAVPTNKQDVIRLAGNRIIYRITCTVIIVDTALLKIFTMALLFKSASMEVAWNRWIIAVLRDPWLALVMMAVYLAILWFIPIHRRSGTQDTITPQ